MLKIRMQRVGRINTPAYRIVVVEHTAGPKAGKFVEKVGSYNPKSKVRVLNADRIKYWISVGAKPSDTVHNMLVSQGVIQGKKINVLPAYKAPEPSEQETVNSEQPEESTAEASQSAESPAEETATEEPVAQSEEAPVEASSFAEASQDK